MNRSLSTILIASLAIAGCKLKAAEDSATVIRDTGEVVVDNVVVWEDKRHGT